MRGARAKTLAAIAAMLYAASSAAAPVRIFRTQSAESFLRGEVDGVAVDAGGVLALARRAERIAEVAEPFAFALARTPTGWAVGTGSDGRVLAIDDEGLVSTLLDAEESEIFALWGDPDGAVYAGSSPAGRVYRLRDGRSEVVFDPEETYVWAIARDAAGALWVATGAPGRLYRLGRDGAAERIWDGGADHVRSLAPLPNGDVLFGTASDGRLLRWRAGSLRTLHDSELTEVVAIAPAADGAVWAAVLSSEASFVELAPRPAAAEEGDGSGATVTVDETGAAGSRPAGARGPRSALLRVAATGAVEQVWSTPDETIFALAAEGGRLWAGTGLEGRLYLFEHDEPRVEKEVEAKQVVGLAPGPEGPVLLTANGGGLWRLEDRREARGTYTSAVLDALQPARFGVLRWSGDLPPGAKVSVAFRTGFAADPDATWTDWVDAGEGPEVSLAAAEPGRFVQYRLELAGREGRGPRVASTELSYRQENVRPDITSLLVLDAGQILVPTGFNPADQLYEPASPNREGIFDTLRPAVRDERLKTVWRKGWRTLRWEAADPNGDELRYRLEVRPEGSPEGWLRLVGDHEESHFAFDATALPDGVYRFRLVASDVEQNDDPGRGLEASRETEPVVVDHTAPGLRAARRRDGALRVTVYDDASPIRSAEVSFDGAEWRPARAADDLLDGRDEELVIDPAPEGARTVLLRVVDSAFNVRTFDLLAEAGE
jgi:hypothetical protein